MISANEIAETLNPTLDMTDWSLLFAEALFILGKQAARLRRLPQRRPPEHAMSYIFFLVKIGVLDIYIYLSILSLSFDLT